MKKGDTTTNVILFLAVFVAALILTTWYIQSVRPTRYLIGAVSEDIEELRQHISNACTVTVYEATYLLATQTPGTLITNATHYCISTEIFGSCTEAPCPLDENQVRLGEEYQLLRIEKDQINPVRIS